MSLAELIPEGWQKILYEEINAPYFHKLEVFLDNEWKIEQIFPPKEDIFTALKLTPYEQIKVFIVGQDPYHDDNQAHGLAFSVKKGIKIPPSLRNIFKELDSDLEIPIANNGFLESWAEQGVLLLNTVLTVRAHQANSHAKHGWETFTDAVIKKVNKRTNPVIFILWGNQALKKMEFINTEKHIVISSAHPSPLSAHRGFFGSKPFSKVNNGLISLDKTPVNWVIPPADELSDLPLFEIADVS
jgi:uracil-DNA glycosylase